MKSQNAIATECPPLRQSIYEDMACSRLFVEKHVLGNKAPETSAAHRGTVIHRALADYLAHLVVTKQRQDIPKFEELLGATAGEAADILDGLREMEFDHANIFGIEKILRLDKNFFTPALASGEFVSEYEGTLDLAELNSEVEATITDWKSYFQVSPVETFQSRFYALLVFCTFPKVQIVRFRTEYVRYRTAREITFTREDADLLRKTVRDERKRQKQLYAEGLQVLQGDRKADTLPTYPGRHCLYCPLLYQGTCPLGSKNPMAMDPKERVLYGVWLKQAQKINTQALKDYVRENGPVVSQDGNGKEVQAHFARRVNSHFLLAEVGDVILEWALKNGDEKLRLGAKVTGIKSFLGAKNRASLAAVVNPLVHEQVSTQFKIEGADDDDSDDEPNFNR